MNRSLYAAVPLMIGLLILQASVLSRFLPERWTPQLLVVAAVAWGLLRGPYDGLVWAFLAGILLDLYSVTPLGVSSLALMIAVVVVLQIKQTLPENPYLLPIVLTAAAAVLYFIAEVVLLRLTGYSFGLASVSTLWPVVLLQGLLGLPAFWLLYALDRALYPPTISA